MSKPHLKPVENDAKSEQRSPEREALAKAIANLVECKNHIDAVRKAQEVALRQARTARGGLEAAEASVDQAKVQAGRHLVDSALGKIGSVPTTVQAARAAVEVAKDNLDAALSAQVQLEKEFQAAENKLNLAVIRHRDAVRAAVATDSVVIALHDEKEKLQARLRMIDAALFVAAHPFRPLTGNDVIALNHEKEFAPDFAAAVEAFVHDADAILPLPE